MDPGCSDKLNLSQGHRIKPTYPSASQCAQQLGPGTGWCEFPARKKALKDDELFQENSAEDHEEQATNDPDEMANKSLLRGLLVGASLDKLYYRDIFEGLTDAQVDSVLSPCTDIQATTVRGFRKQVTLGILIQIGAGGTGKTTGTVQLILARMLVDQPAGVYATANTAMNNIYGRLVEASKKMDTLPAGKLYVRMWSPRLEEKVVTMVDRENIDRLKTTWVAKTGVNSTGLVGGKGKSQFNRLRESTDYDFVSSIAWLICQVAGLVTPENEKLTRLSQDPKYEELREIMEKLVPERTPEEVSTLRKLVDEVTMDLMDVIDILFATTTAGASKAGKKFAARAHLCVIDEAGATTELEVLSVHRGGRQQLFMVGNRAQLPPVNIQRLYPVSNFSPQRKSLLIIIDPAMVLNLVLVGNVVDQLEGPRRPFEAVHFVPNTAIQVASGET